MKFYYCPQCRALVLGRSDCARCEIPLKELDNWPGLRDALNYDFAYTMEEEDEEISEVG